MNAGRLIRPPKINTVNIVLIVFTRGILSWWWRTFFKKKSENHISVGSFMLILKLNCSLWLPLCRTPFLFSGKEIWVEDTRLNCEFGSRRSSSLLFNFTAHKAQTMNSGVGFISLVRRLQGTILKVRIWATSAAEKVFTHVSIDR